MQLQRLSSDVRRTQGDFLLVDGTPPYLPDATPENLKYRETILSATVNQLLGDGFSTGVSYVWDRSDLEDIFPDVPLAALSTASRKNKAVLQTVTTYLLYNHPCGFFARGHVTWYHQRNSGYNPGLPGDDFCQENIYAGYRCLNRRLELELGLLNLSGQDCHLNPLSVYTELPRTPTFMARIKFLF